MLTGTNASFVQETDLSCYASEETRQRNMQYFGKVVSGANLNLNVLWAG